MRERPLRILQILRAPIGGLYRHVVDVATELSVRGHEIALVMDSGVSDNQTEGRLAALAPKLTLGVHKFPIPRLLGVNDLTTPGLIRSLAENLKIDVVHGHGAKGGLHARLACLRRKSRVAIYTPHGGVLHFKPGTMAGRIFPMLERMMLSKTGAIVFESHFSSEAYAQQIARPTCLAPVIHNGLAPEEFIQVPARRDAVEFLYVGELRSLKGIYYMLDALVPVKTKNGRPARLVIAGDGAERQGFEARIAALGLNERVELVGVQPVREMLARGRCMLVPSLAESLPYVVLEAAAAGKPVIATKVGGIAEIFGPTASALIPAADTRALGNAMQGFVDDMPGARQEAQTRYDFVHETFSLKRMVDGIERTYYEALALR